MRALAPSLTLVLLLLVPAASAEYYEGKPDCPPDMFCTESVSDGEAVAAPSGGGGAAGFLAVGTLGVLAAVLAVRRR